MEDRKRSADVKGFIQHLSPRKTSRKGNPYFTFQLQTSAGEVEKVVGYCSQKYEDLQRFEECRSPIKIKKLNKSDGTSILNDNSVVAKLNNYDVNFQYQEMENPEHSNAPTISKLVQISELNDCEVATGTFFSVKAILAIGDFPMKMVVTKFGKDMGVKEDCYLEDESGGICFHIWDNLFIELKTGTSYHFENLQLKRFKGKRYLASTAKTNKTELKVGINISTPSSSSKK